MTVACIVQARLGSTRLPAKVLLPLPTGRTVIGEVLFRCLRIPGVDSVVAAIPDTDENDILASVIRKAEVESLIVDRLMVIRGPEHDVLARYAKAAEAVNADIIMRITADCPLLDPGTCGAVLSFQKETGADYVSNSWPARSYPHGWDCEVFTREVLERANASIWGFESRPGVTTFVGPPREATPGDTDAVEREADQAKYFREHAGCPWMQMAPGIKRRACLKAAEDRSHLRWTLDTMEKGPDGMGDYERIWRIFEEQMRAA